VGTKAERRAARERISAYHQSQLAELLGHVEAAIDRYRTGEIDAYAVDETIQHYHRAAANSGSSAPPAAGHPRRVHRRPPRPHHRRCRSHRLVGTRHTATTPMITTVPRSRCECRGY